MNLEARLCAIEADLAALKRHLNLPPPESRVNLGLPVPHSAPPPLPAGMDPSPVREANSRGPSKEVAFGAYWATRVGATLVLLAAIFLAAYVSIFSSPGIRVSELILGSSAALGIAYWQQRQGHTAFAAVLHSLADALLFFTAFAAYAFTATRVISDLNWAIVAQAVAAIFVCGHALHRRSEASATFGLVLLAWAAGFSLGYEHSQATFAFVALISVGAAVLRYRQDWSWPLLFAAAAGPALAAWLDFSFPNSTLAVQISLTVLPLLVAIPVILSRGKLGRADTGAIFVSLGASVAAALAVRYSAGESPIRNQLLFDAIVFLAIAIALNWKTDRTPARGVLGSGVGFGAAAIAALHLHLWLPENDFASLYLLGLGVLTAGRLRSRPPAVPSSLYFIFWGLALIHRWPFAAFPFAGPPYFLALAEVAGSAILILIAMERESLPVMLALSGVAAVGSLFRFNAALAHSDSVAVLSFLGIAIATALCGRRFKPLAPWAIAALSFAHLRVLADSPLLPPHWFVVLAALTVVDAAALYGLTRLKTPANRGLQLLVPLVMLGALFFGFAASGASRGVTFVWASLAGGTFLLGYWKANQDLRLAALMAFGACIVRLFAIDLSTTFTRIVAFFTLGIILIGVGYLYSRLHPSADKTASKSPAAREQRPGGR
jgi:hypothetical protein